jgi:pyridoxine/pyridoxamine 5'-phosphate oxidase
VALLDLQRAIDSTLTTAGPLAQRIYANQRWSAASVQQFINKVMGATVATVRADGKPHAAVALAACLDGTVHFTASPGSALLADLRRQKAIALTVTDRDHDLTIFGEADLAGRASEVSDLMHNLRRLSRRGQFTPPGWDGYLYAVRIERIFLST